LIRLNAYDVRYESDVDPDQLRPAEKEFVTVTSKIDPSITLFAFYDLRPIT